MVNRDPRVRQRHPDPRRIRSRRVDHDRGHPGAELRGLLSQPALHAAPGPARSEAEQQSPTSRVGVDERREPRVRASPPGRLAQPADASGPGLIDAQHRRRCRCWQPPGRGDDQGPVGGVPVDAVLGSDLRHRPVRPGDRPRQMLPQSCRQPRPRWDRRGPFQERAPRTGRRQTDQPALAPPQLDPLPRCRQVLDPTQRAVLDPSRDRPALRARTLPRPGLDHHPDRRALDTAHVDDDELVQAKQQRHRFIHARGLCT